MKIVLIHVQCPQCGMYHAVPEKLYENSNRDSNTGWYCPLGHFIGRNNAEDRGYKNIREKLPNNVVRIY